MARAQHRNWDSIFTATLAGMLADLAKDAVNSFLYLSGAHHVLYWELAATVFVGPEQAGSAAGLVIGGAACIILGGTLGLAVLQVLRSYGFDLWWYKGVMAGGIIWFFASGLAVDLVLRYIPSDPAFRLYSLLDHMLFGLIVVYLIRRWTLTPAA